MPIIDQIPLWSLFALTVGLALLTVEAGFRLGTLIKSRSRSEDTLPVGAMVQTTLTLVAFVLAFAFSAAGDHFDTRRILIIEEANSIGTTFLRADFLPESSRHEVKELLRQYVALRLQVARALKEPGNQKDTIEQAMSESERLQDRLWSHAAAIGRANLDSDVVALFVESLNETIDLQSKRVAAGLYTRIPDAIWLTLYVILCLGTIGVGYQFGLIGERSWTAIIITILSFGLVMMMIADLDRPTEGALQTGYKPLIDLGAQIGAPTPDSTTQQPSTQSAE